MERERRTLIDAIGRITDGTVIDVHELPPSNGHYPQSCSSTNMRLPAYRTSARRRDLSAAVDQLAFLPARLAHLGEVRPAQSGEFTGGFGKLDGAEAVGRTGCDLGANTAGPSTSRSIPSGMERSVGMTIHEESGYCDAALET